MDERKQRLKFDHRDRLVKIGRIAVDHALEGLLPVLPMDAPERIVANEYLRLLDNKCRVEITKIVRADEKRLKDLRAGYLVPRPKYSAGNNMIQATEKLLSLSVSQKYVNNKHLDLVLIPCWDAFIFVSDFRMHQEMDWQNKVLDPIMRQSFETLWDAEKSLRTEARQNKRAA